MSFQAYLDTILAKTGKTGHELAAAAKAKGLAKPGDVVAWLRAEHGLGHGHAMAVVAVMKSQGQPKRSADERLGAYFSGARTRWRPAFEALLAQAQACGPEVEISPAASYVSLTRDGRKFAIVQANGERLDLGLKLKGEPALGRLEPAGAWNAMVTHRVRIGVSDEVDDEIRDWLRRAYEKA